LGAAGANRSVLGPEAEAAVQSGLDFAVGAGDDVGSDEAVADPFAGIGTGAHSGVDGAGFASDEDGDVTATDEFTTDQTHFGGFRHGISGFDRGDKAAGLNHAEGDAHGFVCHYLLLEEGVECSLATLIGRLTSRQAISAFVTIMVSAFSDKPG